MSSITEPFLKAQMALYATQSEAAESGFVETQPVDCGDVEDAIALGIATFTSLRRHSETWAADTATGRIEFSWDVSRRFTEQYRRWKQRTDRRWKQRTAMLLKVVDRCKAQRRNLAGEGELRDAFRDVSLMPLDTDQMRAAYESMQAGEGISHSEAMNELRRRMAARRA